jgi:hypothetical protein
VRDSSGQLTQDFHFLRSAEFRFEASALFFQVLTREALPIVVI